MEIDIDTYFWMVDRGLFDDDQKNKVDMERGKVILYREHGSRFENALYVAQLMMLLKKSVVSFILFTHFARQMKISKKPFTLDPQLNTLKDNPSLYTKSENWTLVVKELKVIHLEIITILQKFGIRIDGDKKERIIEGKSSLICDVLGRLFDFDTGISNNKIIDINSSVIIHDSHARENSLSASRNSPPLKAIDDSLSYQRDRGLKVSQSLIINAPVPKKNTLEPLEHNKTLNVRQSSIAPDVSTNNILNKNFTLIGDKK